MSAPSSARSEISGLLPRHDAEVLTRDRIKLAGLVISGLAVITALSVVGDRHSSTTEITDWVEALSTAAAFLAAVVAAWYAIGAFRLEFRRESRWEKAQESAQASLVAAWMGMRDEEPPGTSAFRRRVMGPTHGVWVRNASELPVYGARAVVLFRRRSIAAVVDVGLVPPSSEAMFVPYLGGVATQVRKLLAEPTPHFWEGPETELFFISGHVEWIRDGAGDLIPWPGEPWWLGKPAGLHTVGGTTLVGPGSAEDQGEADSKDDV